MYESCSPRRIDEIIAEVFDPTLNPHGFLRSAPRKYARKRIEHTHDVIEVLSQKINLRMIWGVSLDFCSPCCWPADRDRAVASNGAIGESGPALFREQRGEPADPRFDISTIRGEDLMQQPWKR